MPRTLDPNSVIPLYHQLKEILKDQIEAGVWKPGDMIPSEHQLMQEHNISRNTVKKALDDLVQEGVLRREQGKGTFVSLPKIEQSLTGFYSFSKVMRARGYEPSDVILDLSETEAATRVAHHLNRPERSPVMQFRRLRCADGEPIILETSYLPAELVPGLTREMLENQSLYDVLQEHYGIFVTRAREIFEPVLVREYESELLQVEPGFPALLLDRIAYDVQGRAVEFCRSVVRGDRCRFYTELL